LLSCFFLETDAVLKIGEPAHPHDRLPDAAGNHPLPAIPEGFLSATSFRGNFPFSFYGSLALATQADLFAEGKLPGFPSHSGCAFTLSNPCAMAKRCCFSG
jgi:hypothetical protein